MRKVYCVPWLSTYGVKGHHVEEVVSAVVILESVSGQGERSQSAAKNHGGKMHNDCGMCVVGIFKGLIMYASRKLFSEKEREKSRYK